MSEPTNNADDAEAKAVEAQTPDDADTAAGYRSVVDPEEVDQLGADNPNVVTHEPVNHTDHIGDEVDDDVTRSVQLAGEERRAGGDA